MKKINSLKPRVIAIVGPTASGKSSLAIKLARHLNSEKTKDRYKINGAEIISADSRQVYKHLNLGSGKISPKEMHGIPHHLLDVADPQKIFTVAKYQTLAQKTIKRIIQKNKIPILCGGTGMYIDAVLDHQIIPEVKPNHELRKILEQKTTAELFLNLKSQDPNRAQNIDPYNRRRLIRALEIIHQTGKPVPPPKQAEKNIYKIIKIGLNPEKVILKNNIKKVLHQRIKLGLIEEAITLNQSGVNWSRLSDISIYYQFIPEYLSGIISKSEMLEKLETRLWHYAKRQITWFKRDHNIHWIKSPKEINPLLLNFLKKENGPYLKDRGSVL
jgi:tRNA dimethylallyltransferase